jgi:hypothetical protein
MHNLVNPPVSANIFRASLVLTIAFAQHHPQCFCNGRCELYDRTMVDSVRFCPNRNSVITLRKENG